jgi:hypothetical protein
VSITKVVVFFTKNPKKLVLHFSEFSKILYGFYKIQPKVKHYFRTHFQAAPRIFSKGYKYTLAAQMDPWKDLGTRNWVPRRRPAPVRPKSGEPAARSGRARAGKGPAGPRGSIPVLGWGRERAGEGGHRRPAAVAAATAVPAMGARCRGLGTIGEI